MLTKGRLVGTTLLTLVLATLVPGKRKLGGSEGFLIMFQSPGDDTTSWWNLGGWVNKQHGIEAPGVPLTRVPGSIETGRWYDIRVELEGASVRCYLDGKLVQEVKRPAMPSLYTVASREEETGEVILKVVNPTATPVQTAIRLRGAGRVAKAGTAIELTADDPERENSLDEPLRVVPRQRTVRGLSEQFSYRFPAHSLTVLRLRARGVRVTTQVVPGDCPRDPGPFRGSHGNEKH